MWPAVFFGLLTGSHFSTMRARARESRAARPAVRRRGSVFQQLVHRRVRIERAIGDAGDGALDAILANAVAQAADEPIAEQALDLAAGGVAAAPIALAALAGPYRVTRDRGDKVGDALARRGDGPQDGRLPFGAQLAQGEHLREVAGGLIRARSVRLVHDEDVGDLEDTGLDRLDVVAEARHRDEADRVDDAHDVDLLLSHPDRLDEDDAVPD